MSPPLSSFVEETTTSGPLGGEAGDQVLVSELLCGEALSPGTTHCPARGSAAGYSTLFDSNDNFDHIAPHAFGTSRLSPFNPIRGSSFPSKIGENHSPCSVHPHVLPNFCVNVDTAMAKTNEAPSSSAPSLMISTPGPTFLELGEAMRVLQEREAQMAFRLTDCYVDVLMEADIDTSSSSSSEVLPVRRDAVFHIFKLVEGLRLRNLIASQAIAYLDRFLNALTVSTLAAGATSSSPMPFQYIATACVSIAAKMDATAAPSLASLSRFGGDGVGKKRCAIREGQIRDMEAVVLQVLGWKLLGVTTLDFVDNLLAHLPLSGVPSATVQIARRRADDLVHAILTEVEFLDFEQSIIGLCVMQFILDEILPLRAGLLMAILRTVLVVDTLAEKQCYKTLVDLVVERSLILDSDVQQFLSIYAN